MINLRQNKGFAMVFSLIFLILIVSFMAVYILAVANGISIANRTANLKKAYYVADAGLADAYERITKAGIVTFPAGTFIPSASTDNGVYSVGNGSGNYTVTLAVTTVPRLTYTITSKGTYGNESKTLQLKMISASISKYAYWSQTEINPSLGTLWWITGMLTVGPVQTNGSLNIYGNPIFNGAVTEVGASPNYYHGVASNPAIIFPAGLTNNAPQINLPPAATLGAIKTTASSGGLVLTGASTVIFNPAGTITVTGKVTNAQGSTIATYNNTTMSPPSNGIIYVQNSTGKTDGNATVQGTVNGQLTLAADQNIYLSGSVAYNSDPRTHPSSTDMIGLVANQNITVVEASAPTQLEVAGVMVALQGSFNVDQYWVNRGNASTAVMDQFGSLINNYCGATGVFNPSNGQLTGGWNQIQSYDNRLAITAPPGFPPYTNNAGYAIYTKLSVTECLPSGLSCG